MLKTILITISLFICTNILYSQATSTMEFDAGSNIEVTTGADICADLIIINGTYSGGGTQCSDPLPVTMFSLTASVLVNTNNVSLKWITENEINNARLKKEEYKIKELKENIINAVDLQWKEWFVRKVEELEGA